MADTNAYLRTLATARATGLALSEAQLRAFMALLAEYAEELSVRVAAGLATRSQRYALATADEILQQLARDLALSTRNGVTLTARRLAEIHARATAGLMQSAGVVPPALFGDLAVSAAGSVLARPELAASFRSIRRDSVDAVDRILHRAILRGATADQVERELRLHVLGAEAFPERLLRDRRRIGYDAIEQLGYEPTRANLEAVRAEAGRVSARARLIARTEVMQAEMETNQQAAAASPVVGLVRWRLSRRHPEVDPCDALADTDWFGYGPGRYLPGYAPPRPHPRCFLPGTLVQGRFLRGFRAQYDGDVIEIRSRSGDVLTVTPNHPILTPDGFVAAGRLGVGDRLLRYAGDVVPVSSPVAAHEQDAPALIEDVFSALAEDHPIIAAERSSEHFHGDGIFCKGEVEVVGPDGVLLVDIKATIAESLAERGLVPAAMQSALVDGAGPLHLLVPTDGAASSGFMRPASDSLSERRVFSNPLLDPEGLCFGQGAELDVCRFEAIRQSLSRPAGALGDGEDTLSSLISRDVLAQLGIADFPRSSGYAPSHESVVDSPGDNAELARQLLNRFPGKVAVDDVLEISVRHYDGHVYDLQAETGYLVAENIIASNCLCLITHELLPVSEWGKPRGAPRGLELDPAEVAAGYEFSPSQERSLVAALDVARRARRQAAA